MQACMIEQHLRCRCKFCCSRAWPPNLPAQDSICQLWPGSITGMSLIIMKIPEMWNLLTRHLKMLEDLWGSSMWWYNEITDSSGWKGEDSGCQYKTFGYGSTTASSSLATEQLTRKTVKEALTIKNSNIIKKLCFLPMELHCTTLAEDTIKATLANYKLK